MKAMFNQKRMSTAKKSREEQGEAPPEEPFTLDESEFRDRDDSVYSTP